MVNELGVFAKYWRPGAVKTRLAKTVGDLAASSIYRAFLESTLRRCDDVGNQRTIAFSPASQRSEFASLAGNSWQLVAQRGGDLGERMRNYFADSVTAGKRVVLIGSDSPTLPVEYIRRAFRLLEEFPAVLGPTEDGGYYLLGLNRVVPDLFDSIAWSTGDVFAQTTQALRAQSLPFRELPPWYDIDEYSDLERLRMELSAATADVAGARLQGELEALARCDT